MRRLYIILILLLGYLAGIFTSPLPGMVHSQGPPEKRTVHKFVGQGRCIENEIPIQAPANGWLEGECPDESAPPEPTSTEPAPPEPTPTPKPPDPTPTPRPPDPTNTPRPEPTATDRPDDNPEPTPTDRPDDNPTPTATPEDDDDPTPTPVEDNPTPTPTRPPVTLIENQISSPLFSLAGQDVCEYGCCPLDPSEVKLNYSKAALLDAIAEQVRAGNMPVIHIDID